MSNRFSILFALIAFTGLFFLAVDHYIIRGLFLDGSFFLFFMIKEETFNIENYRFGAALTQLLPMGLIKGGATLRSIVWSYSVSYIIYYLILYLVLFFGMNKKGLAWGMLISLLIMAGASFYWPISELQHGMAFTFLLLGVWDFRAPGKNRAKWWAWLLLLPLTALYTGFHPLLLFGWFITGGYFLIAHKWYKNPTDWAVFLFVLAAIILKNYLLKQPYEESRMEYFKNVFYFFPRYHHLPSMKAFGYHLITQYYGLSVCMILLLVYWIRQKRWLSAIWIVGGFMAYLILIKCSYPELGVMFYHENMLLILGMVVALPFGQEMIPNFRRSRFTQFLFFLILATRLLHMQLHHLPFERHLRFYAEQVEGAHDDRLQKVILTDVEKANAETQLTWASSFESLMLSSLDSRENSVTVVVMADPKHWGDELTGEDGFFTEWSVLPVSDIPRNYFLIGNQAYTVQREAW